MATQQQYGAAAGMMKDLLRAMLNTKSHVVIVGQERTFAPQGEDGGLDVVAPAISADVLPSVIRWLAPAADYVVQTFLRPKMIEQRTSVTDGKGQKREVVTKKRGHGVEYCLRTEPHDVYQTKFRLAGRRPLPDVIVDPTYTKIARLISGE
jgi:hypothetical protein